MFSSSRRRGDKESPPEQQPMTSTTVLSSMAPKWRNWWIRGFFTLILLGVFALVLYIGPLSLLLGTLIVQMKCFQEIITIGYGKCKEINMPLYRTLNWYFLIASNYFFYGEMLPHIFFAVVKNDWLLTFLVHYHKLISFLVYTIGIVTFVLTLKKEHYRAQFTIFGWTHVTLLIIVTQSHLIVQNMFEGLIWFAMPLSLVVCNDCMAYIFGFFFGRTSLIKLSPKKTWEGFLGAFFSTLLFAFLVSYILAQYEYFYCPVEYKYNDIFNPTMTCKPSHLFIQQEYQLPFVVRAIFGKETISLYPVQLHSLVLASFASWIAPFGGFMASGFKRAFQIKDFGDLIPGHGGIMDRFDCQYLMATFSYVYIVSFVRAVNPNKVLQLFLSMTDEEQVTFYNEIKSLLTERNLLV